jgi:uncharacterized membrane protein YccF (DUF307 family)
MSSLGNIVWLVFGGFLTGLGYIIGGISLCLTLVGIPFGVQSVKLGLATMAPFGLEIVHTKDAGRAITIILNVIWLLLFGWEIAVAHLVSALVLAITIVGLPFAKQHLKLAPLALFPFGRELR